jgi:phosphoglycerate dehydrogenase-like enzyme
MVERVLVVGPKDTLSMVDDLAPKGFEIVKALHNSPEQKAAIPGTDYFVGFVQQYVNPQLFKDAPKLKLIQLLSAGYDRADLKAARASKIPLCNNGGANSVAVSEHALLLMLAVSRRLITQHGNVTAGRWHGNAPPTVHEVRNKVLGIVGLGTIGKKVARLAQAFGMVVHYYDIARLKEEEEDALGVRFRLLPEILRHSDILSLLTAHLAGPTWESNVTRLRNGFDNVQRVARGEPALWVVPELL